MRAANWPHSHAYGVHAEATEWQSILGTRYICIYYIFKLSVGGFTTVLNMNTKAGPYQSI